MRPSAPYCVFAFVCRTPVQTEGSTPFSRFPNMKKKDKGRPNRCLYDWKDGSDWLLACQVCASQHTVARMLGLDHDILEELFRRGMLTGAVLEEARKEFSTKEGEEWLCEF